MTHPDSGTETASATSTVPVAPAALSGGPARHPDARYVVITGSIAAGATTLSTKLIDRFGWRELLEGHVDQDNPFFVDSNDDPHRWRFHSQVHFLTASVHRHDRLREMLAEPGVVVEDRTPFEHNGAYTAAHETLGNITPQEAAMLGAVGDVVERHYLTPDLLIFREMSRERLPEAVAERARPGEDTIDVHTLEVIWKQFNDFAERWDRSEKILVPADLDVYNTGEFDELAERVNAALRLPA